MGMPAEGVVVRPDGRWRKRQERFCFSSLLGFSRSSSQEAGPCGCRRLGLGVVAAVGMGSAQVRTGRSFAGGEVCAVAVPSVTC